MITHWMVTVNVRLRYGNEPELTNAEKFHLSINTMELQSNIIARMVRDKLTNMWPRPMYLEIILYRDYYLDDGIRYYSYSGTYNLITEPSKVLT